MAREYTQQELERMVVGEQPNPQAVFFEKAQLDVIASKKAKRRIYKKRVYIKLTQPGMTDFMSFPATDEHIKEYPLEYEFFQKNRQGVKAPSIDIIPGLDIIHMQELVDMGLPTIPALAAAEQVPQHLEYAYQMAQTLNAALQEKYHGKVEGHGTGHSQHEKEADHQEEGQQEIEIEDHCPEDVPSANREQRRPVDVGRPAVPRSQKVTGDILSPNWNISIG